MNPLGLVKNFTAETEIPKRRIVAFGATDGHVALAGGAAGVMGVSGIRGGKNGGRVDIYLSDFQDVEFGGPVANGDYVTADADGRAIKAAPGAGVTMDVVGRAFVTGPAGSTGTILVQPQQITG